jgi:hypothetical protein
VGFGFVGFFGRALWVLAGFLGWGSTVFWVFVWGYILYFGCLMGASVFWVYCGFWELGFVEVLLFFGFLVDFIGFSLWARWVFLGFFWVSWVVPVYTTCVFRGALRFFNIFSYLLKKTKLTKF